MVGSPKIPADPGTAPTREDPEVLEARRLAIVGERTRRGRGATLLAARNEELAQDPRNLRKARLLGGADA